MKIKTRWVVLDVIFDVEGVERIVEVVQQPLANQIWVQSERLPSPIQDTLTDGPGKNEIHNLEEIQEVLGQLQFILFMEVKAGCVTNSGNLKSRASPVRYGESRQNVFLQNLDQWKTFIF